MPKSERRRDSASDRRHKHSRKSQLCVKNEPSGESSVGKTTTHRQYHRPLTPDTSPIRLLPFSPSQVKCHCLSGALFNVNDFCAVVMMQIFYASRNSVDGAAPTRHVRHLCRNISVDTSRHEVARGHCDRRPRHCCMSHSDELPSTNALSALQHHLSGTLSLYLFRTVTRLHYLNLDLKHICSPPSMLLNCPVRQRL